MKARGKLVGLSSLLLLPASWDQALIVGFAGLSTGPSCWPLFSYFLMYYRFCESRSFSLLLVSLFVNLEQFLVIKNML